MEQNQDDEDDEEFDQNPENNQQPSFPKSSNFNQNEPKQPSGQKGAIVGAKAVENQPHDLEFDLDDSEEIDTEEEQDNQVSSYWLYS